MSLVINEIIGAVINIIVFMTVPFVWWLIIHRKKQNFFKFIGLTRPRLKKAAWPLLIFAVVYVLYYFVDITDLVVNNFGDEAAIKAAMDESGAMQDNAFYGLGFAALLPGLILNFISNGLCEEALFRGFILKRLKGIVGIWPAIIVQAMLFGLMHNGLFMLAGVQVGFVFHIGMLLSTTVAGIFCGILNEKVFDGESIWPSVILHGFTNYITTMRAAFMF